MNKIKASITAFLATFVGWLGILAVPVLILVVFNIVDYITGLMAAAYRKESITSYKSFRGIAKKISQWLLVLVAALMDWLITFSLNTLGINVPFSFFIACAVALWLDFDELISIIENIKDIGTKIPPFLKPLAKHIKKKIEKEVSVEDDGDA